MFSTVMQGGGAFGPRSLNVKGIGWNVRVASKVALKEKYKSRQEGEREHPFYNVTTNWFRSCACKPISVLF